MVPTSPLCNYACNLPRNTACTHRHYSHWKEEKKISRKKKISTIDSSISACCRRLEERSCWLVEISKRIKIDRRTKRRKRSRPCSSYIANATHRQAESQWLVYTCAANDLQLINWWSRSVTSSIHVSGDEFPASDVTSFKIIWLCDEKEKCILHILAKNYNSKKMN